MRAYQAALMIGVAFVMHAGTSASEAGWFRGRNTCYYNPADSIYDAATSPAPSAVPAHTAATSSSDPVSEQRGYSGSGPVSNQRGYSSYGWTWGPGTAYRDGPGPRF
jgi:hypothetical protein